jgi:hypothetical protein
MTENVESLVASININQVLVAILQEHGKLSVPVLNFLESKNNDSELIIDYDEKIPSFTFSLREVKEENE